MRLQKKVSKKEFAQEILVGSIALACLFAIFLFVAIQKSTGKSLSPLAYLWPQEEETKGIPAAATPQINGPIDKNRVDKSLLADNRPAERLSAPDHSATVSQKESTAPSKLPADNRIRTLVPSSRPSDAYVPPPQSSSITQLPNAPSSNSKPAFQSADSASFIPSNKIQLAQHDAYSAKNERRVQPSTFIPSELPSNPAPKTEVPNSNFQPDPPQKRQSTPPIFQVDAKPSNFVPNSAPKPQASPENATRTQLPNSSPLDANHTPRPPQRSPEFEHGQNRPSTVYNGPPSNALGTDRQDLESGSHAVVHSQLVPTTSNRNPTAKAESEAKAKSQAVENSLRIQPVATDSFWSLSQEYYGDGKYFDQLALFNNATDDSDNLPPVVLIPSLKELLELKLTLPQKSAKKPRASGTGFYITQKGETLFEIAKEQLGSAARFAELLRLNRDHLPADCDAQTELKNGTRILLPDKK